MPAAEDKTPQDAPVLPATQARQGRRGVGLIWVLVISMGLLVVIYAVMVGGVWNGRLSQPGGQTRVDAQTLRQTGGSQAQPSPPRQSENSAGQGR
jgi:hypothetical protein